MISNRKNSLISMVYTKYFSIVRVNCHRFHHLLLQCDIAWYRYTSHTARSVTSFHTGGLNCHIGTQWLWRSAKPRARRWRSNMTATWKMKGRRMQCPRWMTSHVCPLWRTSPRITDVDTVPVNPPVHRDVTRQGTYSCVYAGSPSLRVSTPKYVEQME